MKTNPFDPNRFVGYVSKVTPTLTTVHFPNSRLLQKFYYDGDVLHGGLVGNYVIIEGDGCGFIAKIINIELPEKERLFLSEAAFQNSEFHPIAKVEPQVMFDNFSEVEAMKGLGQYPAVGSKVYVCSPAFLSKFLENFGRDKDEDIDDSLTLATFVNNPDQDIKISANALLNRHCAVVGTTGSGKSYTVGKIIEELLKKDEAKVLLIDATGEFTDFSKGHSNLIAGQDAYLDYASLEEEDFFALFRPAGQVQMPKLQEALKSLRIVTQKGSTGPLAGADSPEVKDGRLIKSNKKKADYTRYVAANISEINSANFNVMNLPAQIIEECAGEFDEGKWGALYQRDKDNCASLVLRIYSLINNDASNRIFNFDGSHKEFESINKKIADFTKDKEKLLRIDVSDLVSGKDVSVIFVNAIARILYNLAKKKTYLKKPLVIFLDEAHLFLNKIVKDEYSIEQTLNSFDKIAKECRKYGLFLCLSSQRPMDIPPGILSQMGSFMAHRLINSRDVDSVVNAAPDGSASTLSFLPSLGKGETILVGVDFPMPLNIRIKKIEGSEPSSHTPKLFSKATKKTP